MSKRTIFDYARVAAQAELRILQLLDSSLRDDFAEARSNLDLQKTARSRQGQVSSG